jgi:large subunit ribosomal protein L1
MAKKGKKYVAAQEKIEPNKKYTLEDGIAKVKEIAFAKFDETVELTMWLGVDPRKADQLVRGTIVLPKKPEPIWLAVTISLIKSKAAGSTSTR